MVLATNALASYEAIGRREDLEDEIYMVDPIDTPFLSLVPHVTATGTFYEWQTQGLAANAANNQLEGDDNVSADTRTVTVRPGNYLCISAKIPRVSGTQQAVLSAGRSDELDYQVGLSKLELKRDMETNLIGVNSARNAGADATARITASLPTWITSNVDRGQSGSNGGSGTSTATDGTQRIFQEINFKIVERSCWTNGGKPDTVMLGAFNKGVFSAFTGNATRMKTAEDKTLVATIDLWDGDFIKARVIPNRFQRARECWLIESRMAAVAFLRGRNMLVMDLAKTGDSDRREVLSEYALVVRNQAAHGVVADLTTA